MEKDLKTIQLFDEDGNEINLNVIAFFDMVNPETEEKSEYGWENYKFYDSETGDFFDIGDCISGTRYDVAHVRWGGSWRMPTVDECQELVEECSWQWITYNGVNGQKVTGPNGNSIFLPAVGARYGTVVRYWGAYGYYCSGSSYAGNGSSGNAWGLYFGNDWVNRYYYWDRYGGVPVRPVSD